MSDPPHVLPAPAAARNATASFVALVLRVLRRERAPVSWRPEDPVNCVIGTILSQATNDTLSDRAYRALRKRFPTWSKVLSAPRSEIVKAVRMCGLAAQKAKAIQSFLRHLKETRGKLSLDDLRQPGLDVDAALSDLCRVDGIGVKTAAITLMFGCGADLCAVDTHLHRILRRLRIVPEKASPDRAFRILRPLIPKGMAIELHLQLIRFGRTICKAGRPRCWECPLRGMCPWPHKVLAGSGRRENG